MYGINTSMDFKLKHYCVLRLLRYLRFGIEIQGSSCISIAFSKYKIKLQHNKNNDTPVLRLHADLYLRNWEYLPYSEQHEYYHSTRHLTNFSTLATDYNGFKLHFCVWERRLYNVLPIPIEFY